MHSCARCSRLFEASRSDARFCSGACRIAAHRDRKAARELKFREDAARLLRDQTNALRAGGDPALIATLERRAAHLFGHFNAG